MILSRFSAVITPTVFIKKSVLPVLYNGNAQIVVGPGTMPLGFIPQSPPRRALGVATAGTRQAVAEEQAPEMEQAPPWMAAAMAVLLKARYVPVLGAKLFAMCRKPAH